LLFTRRDSGRSVIIEKADRATLNEGHVSATIIVLADGRVERWLAHQHRTQHYQSIADLQGGEYHLMLGIYHADLVL
jgi:hypothetical protein